MLFGFLPNKKCDKRTIQICITKSGSFYHKYFHIDNVETKNTIIIEMKRDFNVVRNGSVKLYVKMPQIKKPKINV